MNNNILNEEQIKRDLKKDIAKDEAKLYNKLYYAENEQTIIAKMCPPVTCKLCGRNVIANNLKKYIKSAICSKTQKFNLELQNGLEMNTNKKDINKLVKTKKKEMSDDSEESDSYSDSDSDED